MILNIGEYYIYRHIRLDTATPFYIGIGTKKPYFKDRTCKSVYARAYNKTERSKEWRNIFSITDIIVEILLESDDPSFILLKEVEFIRLYGRTNNNTGILCNMTDGGKGNHGIIVSPEVRSRQSERQKGRKGPNKGKSIHSEEGRKLMSIMRTGVKLRKGSIDKRTNTRRNNSKLTGWHSDEAKRRIGKANSKSVYITNIHSNETVRYESCHDVKDKLGISISAVSNRCSNNVIVEGCKWSYCQ